jgi:hypothetical protein
LVLGIMLIVAAVAIFGGVIVVAMGRGGELAPSGADVRPLDGDIVTAADVALLRPPAALWGYDMRSTDEALNRVARTVTERDVEIAELRQQLADMRSAPGSRLDAVIRQPGPPAPLSPRQAVPPPASAPRAVPPPASAPRAVPPPASPPAGLRRAVPPPAGLPPPARPWDAAAGDGPDQASHPAAIPVRGTADRPARPPAGEQSWSAWERPDPSAMPDPGEPESGTGGRG